MNMQWQNPRPQEFGPRNRTLPEIVTRWQESGIARLEDIFSKGLIICIDTVGLDIPDGSTDAAITIEPIRGGKTLTKNIYGRGAFLWKVLRLQGEHPDLDNIRSEVIQLSGIPSSTSSKYRRNDIRPWGDVVYEEGDLEVVDYNPSKAVNAVLFKHVVGIEIKEPVDPVEIWHPNYD